MISRQVLPLLLLSTCNAFSVLPPSTRASICTFSTATKLTLSEDEKKELNESFNQLSEEEKKEAVGNLVADDEWNGLTMELSELVRMAIVEDLKKNTRDFIGKDDYKMGDITKEVDSRVKDEIAKVRQKDEYELGDFVLAMDEMSKKMTEQLTGKGE